MQLLIFVANKPYAIKTTPHILLFAALNRTANEGKESRVLHFNRNQFLESHKATKKMVPVD